MSPSRPIAKQEGCIRQNVALMKCEAMGVGGGGGVNIGSVEIAGCPKENGGENCGRNENVQNAKYSKGSQERSVEVGGGGGVNIPVMEYVEGDKGCPKVKNVGATRVCSNFDILSNMNVCSVTLARTVRDGAMGMLETRPPRSRSRQRAASSSTTNSPLRGTLKTSTMTSTSRSRSYQQWGGGHHHQLREGIRQEQLQTIWE